MESQYPAVLPGSVLPPASTGAAFGHHAVRVASVLAWPALFLVLLVAAWAFMAHRLDTPLVPGAGEVGLELVRVIGDGEFLRQMGITIQRVLLGFALAFAAALAAGIAMGRSRAFDRFMEPAILIGLTVPGLVWALLCVIWFGISLLTSTVAVALSIAPALVLNVAQGVKAVNADLVEMSAVFQLSFWARLRFLWLPTLAPFLLSAIRLGLSLAWKVIVLVEVFGMSSGVGYQLNSEFSSQNVAGVLAWTIGFAGVMALIEYGLIGALERHASRWRRVATL